MEKVKNIFRWIFQNFFLILFVTIILIYLGWLLLVSFEEYSISFENFLVGFTLLLIYGVLVALAKKMRSRSCLRTTLLILATVFFLLSFWQFVSRFPDIDDVVNFNGTIYVLTDNQQFLESNPAYHQLQLTKWKWDAIPTSALIPPSHYHVRLVYDEKMKLVSVVEKAWDDSESLLYTDSIPPREFAFWVWPTEFEEKKYYLTYVCNPNPENKYDCIATYTLYQCELDNTSCVPLPFQYTEKDHQVEEIVMERDKATNNINISFYWDGITTLIFSYGDNPRCYVDGCEILESP